MRMSAGALILAWGLALAGPVHAADGLVQATSLAADARIAAERRIPILVVFTSPGCPYCDRVKAEYLVPMHKDPAYRKRALIREVTIGTDTPLIGFDGRRTTEGAFSAAHKVFMVPTVMVFDARGTPVGEPIVGLLSPDYYFGYLESAIDAGIARMRGK